MIVYLAVTGILLALGIDIALPAFDEIRPDVGLEAGSNNITLIITMYFFGMAAGQLFWGPISDRFGRSSTLIVALLIYSASALVGAITSSFGVLLAARAVWGLGAAAPAVLRGAIARDLYEGDRMARIMSMVMAVFMVGPVLAPLVGQAILLVAPWRAVFVVCAVAGLLHIGFTMWFGDTLAPAARRPLEFGATARAFVRIATTGATVFYTLAYTLMSASFFVFLGSTQPIMDGIYDREEWFAVVFAASGVVMSMGFIASNRLVGRFGARQTSIVSAAVFTVISFVYLGVVLGSGGVPSLALWIIPLTAMNVVGTPLGPSCFALALEPMGDLAGTAAGVVGFVSIALAAAIAGVFDAAIGDTVTPMAIAYVMSGIAASTFLRFAVSASERGRPLVHASAEPVS